MISGVNLRSIVARARKFAPPMRAVMRVAPPEAPPIGVHANGDFAFGGTGPEAAP